MQRIEFKVKQAPPRGWQLPGCYMITGPFDKVETLFDKVSAALDSGIRLIQFRAHWLEESEYLPLARVLSERVQGEGGTLIIKGDVSLLSESWCQGLHLTACQLELEVKPAKRYSAQLLVASCHDKQQVLAAEAMAVDFITLSPVRPTQSHPEARPLGLAQAAILTETATVPVFWLGGMGVADLDMAQQHGAWGVAAIGEFW